MDGGWLKVAGLDEGKKVFKKFSNIHRKGPFLRYDALVSLTHTHTSARNGDNVTKTTPIQGSTFFFKITRQCNYIGGVEAAEKGVQMRRTAVSNHFQMPVGFLFVSDMQVE